MGNFIDLTGQKFGKWTVLRRNGYTKGGKILWLCECDCGNKSTVTATNLKSGISTSCGCQNANLAYRDLEGKKFGRLTVVNRIDNSNNSDTRYVCKCECGNIVEVRSANLVTGNTTSCGCIRLDNIVGQKFGRLTVIHRANNGNGGETRYLCRCDCGNERVVRASHLKGGRTLSCGCYHKQKATKHGKYGTRVYNVWRDMLRYCFCPNDRSYKDYGGRGITVCNEWRDFQNFYYWAIVNGYKEEIMSNGYNKWTIERIDNDGNFEPDNCCWATMKVQNNNKRNNCLVVYKGETLTVAEFAQRINMGYDLVRNRLNNLKWNIEKTITTTPKSKRFVEFNGETLTIPQIAKKYNFSKMTLAYRLNKGMSIKEAIETPIAVAKRYNYKGKDYTVAEISNLYGIDKRTFRSRVQNGMTVAEAIETPIKGKSDKEKERLCNTND